MKPVENLIGLVSVMVARDSLLVSLDCAATLRGKKYARESKGVIKRHQMALDSVLKLEIYNITKIPKVLI